MNHIFTIPKKYLEPLEHILEWHRRNYSEIGFIFNIEHLLSAIDSADKSTDKISIDLDGETYWLCIRESVYDAKMNAPIVGIKNSDILEIYDWANENYLQNR